MHTLTGINPPSLQQRHTPLHGLSHTQLPSAAGTQDPDDVHVPGTSEEQIPPSTLQVCPGITLQMPPEHTPAEQSELLVVQPIPSSLYGTQAPREHFALWHCPASGESHENPSLATA